MQTLKHYTDLVLENKSSKKSIPKSSLLSCTKCFLDTKGA